MIMKRLKEIWQNDEKCDLHIHSHFSDGLDSPEELVKLAIEQGVSVMAITDHDTIAGMNEAVAASEKHGIELIKGIEFSTYAENENFPYISMHMLAYGIDTGYKPLNDLLSWMLDKRNERNERLLRQLEKDGYILTPEDLEKAGGREGYLGKPNIARALVNNGYISYFKDAFKKGACMKTPEITAIHRQKKPVSEIIEMIHDAGGAAVLAHPIKIKDLSYNPENEEPFFESLERLVSELKEIGLDGIECRYSRHTKNFAERIEKLANKMSLICTSGSDYHGRTDGDRNMIGNTVLKDETSWRSVL